MKTKVETYYDKKYFLWMSDVGKFGGKANLFKFNDYIKPDDIVLDFGCGGGYLLSNIETSGKKYGIEINEHAREEALKFGIEVHERISEIPEGCVDVIISNSALEHTDNPVQILIELKRTLKSNGKIVFVVPFEKSNKLNVDDKNMHLYTWGPQQLYNLFKMCGYKVEDVKLLHHRWMPKYMLVQKFVGWKIFHILCEIYGRLRRNNKQVRIVARI